MNTRVRGSIKWRWASFTHTHTQPFIDTTTLSSAHANTHTHTHTHPRTHAHICKQFIIFMICFIPDTCNRWFIFKQFSFGGFYHSLSIYKDILIKTRASFVTQINWKTYSSQPYSSLILTWLSTEFSSRIDI